MNSRSPQFPPRVQAKVDAGILILCSELEERGIRVKTDDFVYRPDYSNDKMNIIAWVSDDEKTRAWVTAKTKSGRVTIEIKAPQFCLKAEDMPFKPKSVSNA